MAGVTDAWRRSRSGVAQGERLGDDDAAVVLDSHDLVAIGMMADEVRRQLHGAETTFVRVFEAHVDAVPAALPAGITAGEFRIVGTPCSIDAACRRGARRCGGSPAASPLFGFSLREIEALGRRSARGVRAAAARPVSTALPRSPVDLTSSADGPVERAARARACWSLRLTVHRPPRDPAAPPARARDLQPQAGGFRAFAPLPRQLSMSAPTTGYDDVKAVALARLLLRDVPSIQVDWPLYGPKLAQVGLIVGADDVDGVAAAEPGALGARRSRARGDPRQHPRGWTAAGRAGRPVRPAGGRRRRSARMRPVRLGAVDYLNARPLVYGLELRHGFALQFDPPSKCAALLHEGSIDVGMIPSIEYLRGAGRTARCRTWRSCRKGRSRRWRCSRTKPLQDVRIDRRRHQLADVERAAARAVLRAVRHRSGVHPDGAAARRDAAPLRCGAGHWRRRAVLRSPGRRRARRSISASSGRR